MIIRQSYAIRSLPSAICMRIIPSEGPVNILNFAANAHWYARGSSQDGSINGSRHPPRCTGTNFDAHRSVCHLTGIDRSVSFALRGKSICLSTVSKDIGKLAVLRGKTTTCGT